MTCCICHNEVVCLLNSCNTPPVFHVLQPILARLAVHLWGELFADAVVCQFQQHTGVWVPLLTREGELPHQNIPWLQITEEDVFGMEIGHSICHLQCTHILNMYEVK